MTDSAMIAQLLKPDAWPHPVEAVRLVETHSAWVLLTGEYAYKIKKPVDFGFLDFSTLEKRRFYCEEEIRLNRRFAAQIYLDVVTIGGSEQQPRVGAGGAALEYAVRMRQFADGGLLSQLAAQQRLQAAHIDQLVEVVGRFHQAAPAAPLEAGYGAPERVHHWVRENFEHIRPALDDAQDIEQLQRLNQWSEKERTRIEALLRQRRRDGFIRECHGDLHLGNITLIDDRVTPFDCIEFNPELRWIDVLSEVAFLVMDLDDRGYSGFARRFLNAYLQYTGDYAGLGVLRYYRVYRALVRAKVAMLRRAQTAADTQAFREATAEYHQYAGLAAGYTLQDAPALLITHGLSGSGKSTVARQLCEHTGMLQLRSDIERKRLAGMTAAQRSDSAVGSGLYSSDRTQQTYTQLAALAGDVVRAGYSVIVDATFLEEARRTAFRALAESLRVPFIILHCEAAADELERRIVARAAAATDPSEAGLDVLYSQRRSAQPLTAAELPHTLRVDTARLDMADLLDAIDTRVQAGAP